MKNSLKNIAVYIVIILFTAASVELICYLFLRYVPGLSESYPYFNRQVSPYYLFENTPGYKYSNCMRTDSTEKDVIINRYGFVTDKEISLRKDSNTLRIIICGGSAGFGSGQLEPYRKIMEYQTGIYTYESSVSGLLKKNLQYMYPGKVIEVINACAPQRMLHQSINYYLETLSNFNPDIVISLDGMNDLTTICGISPYEKSRLQWQSFLTLHQLSQHNHYKHSSNLVKLIYAMQLSGFKKSQKKNVSENIKYSYNYHYSSLDHIEYKSLREKYIQRSLVFTRLIQHFNSLCKNDNTRFIFCIQPLLYREKINKSLSVTEEKMRNEIHPNNVRLQFPGISEESAVSVENIIDLTLKYFIDDYLTDYIEYQSKQNDYLFIDFNKEIQQIDSGTEFYIDYCHLTPSGNRIVADILAQKISGMLKY